MSALAPTVQAWFTEHLLTHRFRRYLADADIPHFPGVIELVSSSFAQRSGCLTGRVDLFAAG